MKSKRLITIIVIALALSALVLTACERPASSAPTGPTATKGAAVPQVPAATQSMGGFDTFLTQTAIAKISVIDTEPTATPVPPAAEASPTPPPPPVAVETAASAATAIPQTFPSATPGRPATYTLQKGEFPFCIARRFNVNQNELLSLNGLSLNSRPDVGAVLKIPQTGNPFISERALKPHPVSYTIKAGDTIYTIACAFGDVDPMMIVSVNGLTSPYTLEAGKPLQIP